MVEWLFLCKARKTSRGIQYISLWHSHGHLSSITELFGLKPGGNEMFEGIGNEWTENQNNPPAGDDSRTLSFFATSEESFPKCDCAYVWDALSIKLYLLNLRTHIKEPLVSSCAVFLHLWMTQSKSLFSLCFSIWVIIHYSSIFKIFFHHMQQNPLCKTIDT